MFYVIIISFIVFYRIFSYILLIPDTIYFSSTSKETILPVFIILLFIFILFIIKLLFEVFSTNIFIFLNYKLSDGIIFGRLMCTLSSEIVQSPMGYFILL